LELNLSTFNKLFIKTDRIATILLDISIYFLEPSCLIKALRVTLTISVAFNNVWRDAAMNANYSRTVVFRQEVVPYVCQSTAALTALETNLSYPISLEGFKLVLCIRIGFNANPDPAFYLNADPNKGSQTSAALDPGQSCCHTKLNFYIKNILHVGNGS
jgi:hypothetical protein